MKKKLIFEQPTSCYPNEENVGDEYDAEDDLFEDESNDGHSFDADEKKENKELLKILQYDNLKEKKVPLRTGQKGVLGRLTRGQRRALSRRTLSQARRSAARLRKKLKKNNGEDGVNSITDQVRFIIIYILYVIESNITNDIIFELTSIKGFRGFQWSYFL